MPSKILQILNYYFLNPTFYMSKNDHFFFCNEMTRLMDGGEKQFFLQLMSVSNMGRNKLNDALKAVETGEQKFYLQMSEHSCADFPSSISHCLLTSATMKSLYLYKIHVMHVSSYLPRILCLL